jgi:hypothetical protein
VLVDPSMREVGPVEYRDDGVAPDTTAADGVFAATFEIPPELAPELAANFMVRAVGQAPGETDLRAAGTSFLVSSPTAQLTGRYRDEIRDGSLVIACEARIAGRGRVHLQGALYTSTDEPLAWAQNAIEPEGPGLTWIELTYYGLLFHERGAPGPYTLGTIQLTSSRDMPGAIGDVLEDVHVTQPYPLEAFTREPFGDPVMLDAAERAEGEAVQIEADRREP